MKIAIKKLFQLTCAFSTRHIDFDFAGQLQLSGKVLAKLGQLVASVAAIVVLSGLPVLAEEELKPIRSSLVVNASPQTIFQEIRDKRNWEKVRKVTSRPGQTICEETYSDLPMLGNAKCTYIETYKPFERVDYRMIESDKFKKFEGSWVLTKTGANQTLVELSSEVDTGLRVPFWKRITAHQVSQDVRGRLAKLKLLAESKQSKLTQ